MSRHDAWNRADEEAGADDEPPRCQIDGCREEGLNMVGTGYGCVFRCDEHYRKPLKTGGSPGCSGTLCEEG